MKLPTAVCEADSQVVGCAQMYKCQSRSEPHVGPCVMAAL